MDKIQRIQELVEQLNIYRDEYYNLNKPSISDVTYDQLFDELSVLEKETGYILSNSPTQTVGYEVKSKLQKVEHPIPLKSLDKTKSFEELNKFIGEKNCLLMLKADGLTVELEYENGELIQASTRGNSIIGEEISHNAKVFKNIPLTIPYKGHLRIAGEAIIHKNDFEEINSKLSDEEKYATPRNLVAGSVRQLDSKICSLRKVYFYVFGILECDDELSDSKHKQFRWLVEQGFWTIYYMSGDMSDIELNIKRMKKVAEENFIPIDGMVITYDSVKYSKSLGEVAHHPKHSLAWKATDEMEETILRSVEWNTTRSGQINPTAIFDTVILDNTEVSRASLFNLTFIKDMQLNLLNSIKVSKRNMIIPYIEENLDRQEGNYISIPTECPSCRAKTEIRNTGTADFLYCTNDDCPAKLLDSFTHFVSRNAMNIDGLSSASLEKFIDCGFLREFPDIYKLDQYKSQIVSMEGFGLRSYNKLIEAIEKSKEVKLENFLYALGIGQLGQGGSKRLVKHFNNDISLIANAKTHELTQVEDFGEVTANSVYVYFQDNMDLVDRLLDIVNIQKPEAKNTNTSSIDLTGKTFVVTGEFVNYKPRKKLEETIESLGGKLASSVSKSTFALLTNDTGSGTKKNQDAIKHGVRIMNEAEFMEMIGR